MQRLQRILGTTEVLLHYASQAELVARAQKAFIEFAPGGLARCSGVLNIKSGKVLLRADSGAVAVRLRQLGPSLLAYLRKQGVDSTELEIQVQPDPQMLQRTETKADCPSISAQTEASITHLSNSLPPDSPLRQALDTFMVRAKRQKL